MSKKSGNGLRGLKQRNSQVNEEQLKNKPSFIIYVLFIYKYLKYNCSPNAS